MSRQPLQSLGEVCLVLDSIDDKLAARDRLDEQRRLLDDARDKAANKSRDELMQQTVAQGDRTTTLEANWTAFFSEKGAFPLVIKKTDEHSKKIDRLMWVAAVGFGIIITLQTIMELHR